MKQSILNLKLIIKIKYKINNQKLLNIIIINLFQKNQRKKTIKIIVHFVEIKLINKIIMNYKKYNNN